MNNNKPTKTEIGCQLAKEFWLPISIAIIWLLINIFMTEKTINNAGQAVTNPIIQYINIFASAFFFIGVLTGNYNRVKKQLTVEKNFSSVDNDLKTLTSALTKQTKNLIDTLTGGDSYFDVQVINIQNGNQEFKITGIVSSNEPNSLGKFPISSAEITIHADDVLIFSQIKKDLLTEINYELLTWNPPTGKEVIIFNVQILASNKNYKQVIIMKKHTNNYWYFQKISFNDIYCVLLRQNIFQSGFPDDLSAKNPSNKSIEEELIKQVPEGLINYFKSKEFKHR
jgi:hypothetical protein